MLTSAFKVFINNLFQKIFDTTFMRNEKSCQSINYFFFISHKKIFKIDQGTHQHFPKNRPFTCSLRMVRATTSARANFLSILQEKTYFFYFTHSLLQNTHISLSILHIYLIKYSFFLHFLLFHFLSSLAQTHHLVFSLHTQPATLPQNPAIDSPIFHNNKIRPLIHRSSTTTKSGH